MLKFVVSLICVVAAVVAIADAKPNDIQLFVDTQHSTMTVHVWKQGIFAFAADNHVIDAPIASGLYDSATKIIELKIESAKMRVLDPQLAADRRATVQANMVGPQVLDVQKYAEIVFRSKMSQVTAADKLAVTGDLTLHGQTHPVVLQVVQVNATHFKGSAVVRQSAFGITPIRIAGGTVKVKDDVNIDFDLSLRHAEQSTNGH